MAKIKITEGQYAMIRIHEAADSFMSDYARYQKEVTEKVNKLWDTLNSISVGNILSGEISQDNLKGYEQQLSDMDRFISDLYKRGSQGLNKMSDEEYDAHGETIERLLDDPYYSNSKKITALEGIVASLKGILKNDKKYSINDSFKNN